MIDPRRATIAQLLAQAQAAGLVMTTGADMRRRGITAMVRRHFANEKRPTAGALTVDRSSGFTGRRNPESRPQYQQARSEQPHGNEYRQRDN